MAKKFPFLRQCALYVVRCRPDSGQLALSRPCERCCRYIKRIGIKTVYYSA